jgi:hypothetical protein
MTTEIEKANNINLMVGSSSSIGYTRHLWPSLVWQNIVNDLSCLFVSKISEHKVHVSYPGFELNRSDFHDVRWLGLILTRTGNITM